MTSDDSDADEQKDVLRILSEQEIKTFELVRRVLFQVHSEFTTWNIAHCHQVLTSFGAPSTWQSCLHPDFRSPGSSSNKPAAGDPPPDSRPVPSECLPVSQQSYSPNGTVIETSTMKLDVIHFSSSLEPHPPYESCSPLHRNVFKGDDSDNMAFVPFADDHTFNHIRHTRHYGTFSWRDPLDPDLEVILLETAYRLNVQYALAYDEIEDCGVLPLKLCSQPGKPGLISTARVRDRLNWSGKTIPDSYTFPHPTQLEASDFRKRLQRLNSFFCPNLNCVEPLCSVHVEPNVMPLRLQSLSSSVHDEVTNPCQNQCFINQVVMDNPSWDDADLDMFKVILEITSNATPCDLAELCLKPCWEVLYYKKLLRSSDSDEIQLADIRSHRRALKFSDNSAALFTPNDPCCHTGPCNNSSGCPCSKNQSHCQRNCRCSPECNRRWQGCRCSRSGSKWSCATERCPCVEAFRECDPELCTNCRCMSDGTLCRNSQIQRGTRKALEVKKSSWGLGTYLAEAAKAGDLITEYIGELIYEPTVESREDIATHRNRCYVFGLNDTFSLDSTYAGNSSRFIDHSGAERSRRVNCHARVLLVNGDHRIGIFAVRDMEARSEVLMNYGSRFFVKCNHECPDESNVVVADTGSSYGGWFH